LVHDAHRFAQLFAPLILQSALQIYYSALSFSPSKSEIFKQFATVTTKHKVVSGQSQAWPEYLQCLEGHTAPVTCVAVSPDGSRIVSGSADCTLRIWESKSGACVLGPLQGQASVTSACYSGTGSLITAGYSTGTLTIWTAESGHCISKLVHDDKTIEKGIHSVAFSPDSSILVSASSHQICVWGVTSAEAALMWGYSNHDDDYSAASVTSDGMNIVACLSDRTVYIWDAQSGLTSDADAPMIAPESVVGITRTSRMYIAPGGYWAASVDHDYNLYVWSIQSECLDLVTRSSLTSYTSVIAVSQDGSQTAYQTSNTLCYFKVSDTDSNDSNVVTKHGHTQEIMSLSFFPDGAMIVSGSRDGNVCVWSTGSSSHAVLEPMPCPAWKDIEKIHCMTVAADGSKIATALQRGQLVVWEPRSGTVIWSVEEQRDRWNLGINNITALAFAPDSSKVAMGYSSSTGERGLCILAANNGHIISKKWVSAIYQEWITVIMFSPNGSTIVVGTYQGQCIVWNFELGDQAVDSQVCKVEVCKGLPIRLLTFLPDSGKVSGYSGDFGGRTIFILDASSGALIWIRNWPSQVLSLVSSSDSTRLLANIEGGVIHLLTTESGELLSELSPGQDTFPELPLQMDMASGWVWIQGKRILWLPPDKCTHFKHISQGVEARASHFIHAGSLLVQMVRPRTWSWWHVDNEDNEINPLTIVELKASPAHKGF
jgi:WD40 repeat protein